MASDKNVCSLIVIIHTKNVKILTITPKIFVLLLHCYLIDNRCERSNTDLIVFTKTVITLLVLLIFSIYFDC